MPVYVQHEVIGQVADVFNAEAIWQAPGLALFSRRTLLRDLLERSPREQRGRAATRCFSHVTLMLAQDEVDDDRHLTRGARVRDLVDTLKALHQKDFGDLLGNDDVRYDVVGNDTLRPGQIEVKFGHAVYLPAADEKILYNVSCSRDGAIWHPVCPVYPNQRLVLAGPDAHSATHAIRAWPFGADGGILFINDGPDAPLEVQVRPKDTLDCSFDALAGHYSIKPKHGKSDARLLLKVTRVGHGAKPSTLWKQRAAPDQTAVPPAETEATFAPVAQQRITLAGLALPRLSRYRETGATGMEIGFDRQLGIATGEPVLTLGVSADDSLYASSSAGRQAINLPAMFTPGDGALKLQVPCSAMAERYCALLALPGQASAPVMAGVRLVFGRGTEALAGLRVLDAARFLNYAEGSSRASADRIGLSRNAFSFEAGKDGCQITRQSPTQALYHLDAQFGLVAVVGDSCLLPPGHHLVAGHYVLRFDA
ncbi:MAG: hypothetical protein V4463_03220 [Pseudomonadota bacterium]